MKHVICIQDLSCFGKCSLTIALPVLSSANVAVSVLPTALLSTHTGGLGRPYHRDLQQDMKEIRHHWKQLDFPVDAIYSAYVSNLAQLEQIEALFDTYPHAMKMVDPVMGDHGKLYASLPDGLALGMRRLCAKADLITPNMTEAYALIEEPYQDGPYTLEQIQHVLNRLQERTTAQVVLTGVSYDETHIGSVACKNKEAKISYAGKAKISQDFHGTGDLFASSLLGALCNDYSLEKAIELAVSYTTMAMETTMQQHQDERFGILFEPLLWRYGKACIEGGDL